MSERVVAKRYAAALFDLTVEAGLLDSVNRDIALIRATCAQSAELVAALRNPVLPLTAKKGIVTGVFQGKVSDITLRFLTFLADKNRIAMLQETVEAFILMDEARKGIAEARVISAQPMDKVELDTLNQGLSRKYKKTFTIRAEQDPGLIGGFLLYIGDKVFDFSMRNQLKLLREQLLGVNP